MSCPKCDPVCAMCDGQLGNSFLIWRRFVGLSDVTGEWGWVESRFCSAVCLEKARDAKGVWTKDAATAGA